MIRFFYRNNFGAKVVSFVGLLGKSWVKKVLRNALYGIFKTFGAKLAIIF
ncbi:MAG TPA: hypothetical protein PKH93_05945 [Chitinophagales bacterium]|jgi:hypothetical protein|nr:hypothetical protein [Chitinophagales bacterium]